MTNAEAINVLSKYRDAGISAVVAEAHQMGIEAINSLECLVDRPCSVCKHHTDNGCNQFECVFKGCEA